ncbi:helix-turn-helix transcriptional regulator [Planktothrix sp. FACHB-1355]|uniref:Helix-turn-helix transcriptional regulator n=1 Tax=Aerosakkonema funiforme FACHB-1375 TaxID=2949571 RepID=A0A926VFT7_9CYAN|nr:MULTISPECIES: helix-turn-helix transcriptional regulator [Oscillatoriales]MBD2183109.1 helix-turn-helix transcriptional regulator [Aerosakkonema funiforme FACHB-1375]MBD3558689.1 helix-turn-helix transcriptional regulator [Planktothrix sp. FACHB-1355]
MKSIFSPEYDIFRQRMIAARKEAKLTQAKLAKSLNKPQSFVAKYENGERRLDVIEFLVVTRAIGIDPCEIIREIEQQLAGTSCGEKG